MHEMAITESVLKIALTEAARAGAAGGFGRAISGCRRAPVRGILALTGAAGRAGGVTAGRRAGAACSACAWYRAACIAGLLGTAPAAPLTRARAVLSSTR